MGLRVGLLTRYGSPPTDAAPLDAFSNNACAALGPPWSRDDGGPGLCEAYVVTKATADRGGVLCCRD